MEREGRGAVVTANLTTISRHAWIVLRTWSREHAAHRVDGRYPGLDLIAGIKGAREGDETRRGRWERWSADRICLRNWRVDVCWDGGQVEVGS